MQPDFGYWLIRNLAQHKADHMRRTYEVVFPRGMTHTQVLDFVRSVLGELPRPGVLEPTYSVVFEKFADSNGKKYYFHVPGHVSKKFDKLLDKKIEGIAIDPVTGADDKVAAKAWDLAYEITMQGTESPLRILVSEHVAASIDVNFDALDQDEALVLQWVVIPDRPRQPTAADKDKVGDFTLHAVARIGARGEDAQQMLLDLGASLRSVNSHGSQLRKRVAARCGGPYPSAGRYERLPDLSECRRVHGADGVAAGRRQCNPSSAVAARQDD
jgi:hypothetical protein